MKNIKCRRMPMARMEFINTEIDNLMLSRNSSVPFKIV